MALTRLFVHDTFYDATDNFTYTPGMRLTLDNTTQSARITRLQNSGVVSTDETIDPAGVAITGGTINGTTIGATTAAAGNFTTLGATGVLTLGSTISGNVDASGFVRGTTIATTNTSGAFFSAAGGFFDVDDATDRVTFGISSGAHIGTANSRDFNIRTNGTNRITIAAAGATAYFQTTMDVGFGTTSPVTRVHIRDDAATPLTIQREADGQVIDFDGNGYSVAVNVDATGLGFSHNSGSRAIYFAPNNVTGVTISGAGDMGINETAPDYKLDVNGTFGFTPGTSVTPVDNGDVVFEATSNTTFTVKLKGTDGTVRSGTVTLA